MATSTKPTLKRADMMFRQAMKKDAEGDEAGVTNWLDKAAATEAAAIADGDDPGQTRNLTPTT